ncbi:leukosialin [Xenopus laevis]|uniref:Leukosialin n=1 Tax=Xenopus laevis TaxID=8355 RepID=A0A8J0U668_XENLA|nr:leukosialin [Xenopus laevis]
MGKQMIWCLVLCQCLWFWGALTLATVLHTLQELDSVSPSSGNEIVTDQVQHSKVPDTTTATIAETPEITHDNGSTQYITTQALKPESMSTQGIERSDPVQDKNESRTTHYIKDTDLFSVPTENGTTQKDTVVTSANELESTTGVSTSLEPSISTGEDKIAVIDESDKEVLSGYTTKSTVPITSTTKHDVTKTHGICDDTGLKTSHDGLLTTSIESNDKATGPHSGINHGRHTTSLKQDQSKYNPYLICIISICIVLLALAIIFILVLRKKRRSRSQNFSKRVKKGDNKDVWAGQMPELAEGKVTMGADELDNGMVVSLLEDEQEMTTFVSGEKKGDSGIEIREAEAEANKKEDGEEMEDNAESPEAQEEQKVTKEENLEVQPNGEVETKEEQFPLPPVEQDLVGNEDKAI